MRTIGTIAAAFLAPPLCAACGRPCPPEAVLCGLCGRRLDSAQPLRGGAPPGLEQAWASAPHEGVPRDLVTALKFRRLLPVAGLMGERIVRLAPAPLLSGEVVPVPTSPMRALRRGFDPAAELAAALAEEAGMPLRACLARRGGARQVGRRRGERLGDPPRVCVASDVPRSVVLVDDVLTTGATLSACAKALRNGGARRVVALAFARRL